MMRLYKEAEAKSARAQERKVGYEMQELSIIKNSDDNKWKYLMNTV